jgi:hypothetical protein
MLLQHYLMHLVDAGQHALLPLYACHLSADVRHEVRALLLFEPWYILEVGTRAQDVPAPCMRVATTVSGGHATTLVHQASVQGEFSRYLCCLRGQVYGLFLSMLTKNEGMEACMAAFENGSAWFGAWAEAGRGDVDPAEMAIIVEQVGWRQIWPMPSLTPALLCSGLYCDMRHRLS